MNHILVRELYEQAVVDAGKINGWGTTNLHVAERLTELVIERACQAILEWKKEPFPFDESTAVWILKQHFGTDDGTKP